MSRPLREGNAASRPRLPDCLDTTPLRVYRLGAAGGGWGWEEDWREKVRVREREKKERDLSRLFTFQHFPFKHIHSGVATRQAA